VGGSYEQHGNEPLDYMICGEFLIKGSAPWR